MKKIFLSMICMAAISLHAETRVAYLLPNGCSYDAETQTLSGFDAEEVDGVAQNPELNAAEWFRATYVTGENPTGEFITPKAFVDAVYAEGYQAKALWIHIDRVNVGDIDAFKASLFAGGGYSFDDFKEALSYYSMDGGNLLLSKQATHLVGDIMRAGYPEFNASGYVGADREGELKWFVATNFAGRDNSAHFLYNRHQGDLGGVAKDEEMTFIPAHVQNTDHNCGWGIGALGMENATDYEHLHQWEAENHARVLGTWGGSQDMPYAGIVEFYPYETEEDVNRGTVLCLGLATYMWHANNGGWGADNVRHMTSCALEYLTNEPKGVGENEGEPMEDVLVKDFFFPENIHTDSLYLHPLVENLEASYQTMSAFAPVATIQEVEEKKYLVFSEEGTQTLLVVLKENRDNMPWAKSWFTYGVSVTYSKTASDVESLEAVNNAMKTIVNGQLVIVRDGVRYNAQGAQL